MEPNSASYVPGFCPTRPEPEETGLESFQFRDEIQRLMMVPPENASSFTALLELPATQAMQLLHSSPHSAAGGGDEHKPYSSSFTNGNLTFPSNKALIERAAKFSVFAAAEISPETSSVPSNSSANLDKVKTEPAETDSNPDSSNKTQTQKLAKRKEREKKVKINLR